MIAFVCIFQRDGDPVEPEALHRLAEPLSAYGAETATWRRGSLGIAVRHRSTAHTRPKHGPLEDPDTGRVTVEMGRDGFAAVSADPASGRVRIARDPLGSRGVYYHLDRKRLIAAGEPAAVLRHPAVSHDLDEGSIARFLGFRFGRYDTSFFSQVRRLPPGHRLDVTESGETVEAYWRFRSLPSAAESPWDEVAAEFLRRLERAVADDIGDLDPSRVALSLSGGLDSTALAAVAPRGVRAFSWTFDDTPEADERPRIEAVSRHLDLPVRWVRGDGLHPLGGDFAERFVHVNSPYVNPFAALKCRLYEAARNEGCERVLVGDGGDVLYAGREYWLRDLLADRRPGAFRSLVATVGRAFRGDRFARRCLRRLLPLEALPPTLRRASPWLTPEARAALPAPAPSPILPPGRNAARYELSVGIKHSELESEERRLFAQCGVERGNPFWSRSLLESAIQLPAYRLHRDGRDKVLTRRALRQRLPEEILEGERGGLLGGVFLRGIELHRTEIRERVFRHPRSDWQRWVRRAWVEPYLEATRSIAFGHTILWRVIGYELWIRRVRGDL